MRFETLDPTSVSGIRFTPVRKSKMRGEGLRRSALPQAGLLLVEQS
jgi:hypothetical protein